MFAAAIAPLPLLVALSSGSLVGALALFIATRFVDDDDEIILERKVTKAGEDKPEVAVVDVTNRQLEEFESVASPKEQRESPSRMRLSRGSIRVRRDAYQGASTSDEELARKMQEVKDYDALAANIVGEISQTPEETKQEKEPERKRNIEPSARARRRIVAKAISNRVAFVDEGMYPELRDEDDLDDTDDWDRALAALDDKLANKTPVSPYASPAVLDVIEMPAPSAGFLTLIEGGKSSANLLAKHEGRHFSEAIEA